MLQAIQPSVDTTRNEPGEKVHNCVVANVRRVAGQIYASEPVLKEGVQENGLKIVAADYFRLAISTHRSAKSDMKSFLPCFQ